MTESSQHLFCALFMLSFLQLRMEWIDLAEDRDRLRDFVNAVMNLRFPYNAGNILTTWGPVSFSGRHVLNGVSEWISLFIQLPFLHHRLRTAIGAGGGNEVFTYRSFAIVIVSCLCGDSMFISTRHSYRGQLPLHMFHALVIGRPARRLQCLAYICAFGLQVILVSSPARCFCCQK